MILRRYHGKNGLLHELFAGIGEIDADSPPCAGDKTEIAVLFQLPYRRMNRLLIQANQRADILLRTSLS